MVVAKSEKSMVEEEFLTWNWKGELRHVGHRVDSFKNDTIKPYHATNREAAGIMHIVGMIQ